MAAGEQFLRHFGGRAASAHDFDQQGALADVAAFPEIDAEQALDDLGPARPRWRRGDFRRAGLDLGLARNAKLLHIGVGADRHLRHADLPFLRR
ncbi:MAG: hypothetical protein ABR929_12595 [Roseiarcus sp.]|jgi:hypothetical protein